MTCIQVNAEPQPHGDPANATAATSMPKVFVCPSARRGRPPTEQKDYCVNGGIQSHGCCAERSTTNSSEGMAWLGSFGGAASIAARRTTGGPPSQPAAPEASPAQAGDDVR
jgi:hypothetical protein